MATRYHVRTISLPSRPHPSTIKIEEELDKFKTWEASLTSTSVCSGISGLGDLYLCLDELLNMASTQQVLSRHQHEKCVDELLDGSVKILDICGLTRDILLQIKEHVQVLQSALRRRKGDSRIESSITSYTCLIKKMKKNVKQMIVGLKQMDNKLGASPILNLDDHTSAVIRVLREVNAVSISCFQSLLLFLLAPGDKQKKSRWTLVSKLMHKGAIASEEEQESIPNELQSVDAALCKYASNEESDSQIACQRLEALENSIEGLESSLESVFRRLIKTRASFLNILSQ